MPSSKWNERSRCTGFARPGRVILSTNITILVSLENKIEASRKKDDQAILT